MLIAWIVAALMLALAAVTVLRLPAMHPAQLWAVPWAAMTVLFAMRLLPYKDLRPNTAALVVLAAAGFTAGAVWTGRSARPTTRLTLDSLTSERLWWTTVALLGATVTGACAFVLQVAGTFGIRSALVTSPEVRAAIQDGATSVTIKYVYVAFATAIVGGLAAAQASTLRRRSAASAIIGVAALSTYFSTSRSNIFLAVLIGVLAYAIARPRLPVAKQVAIGAGTVLAVAVAALLIGGSIIGKTFEASELSTVDSPFTRHAFLEPLASPYQYATAPIGALNQLVSVSDTVGGDLGCATVPLACHIGGVAGLGMTGTSSLRPFTARPLRWNLYTGLDGPVMDVGVTFAVPIVMLLGSLAGLAWARARAGNIAWLIICPMLGAAAITSTGQNRFFASHYVGAVIIAMLALFSISRLNPKGIREAAT